MEPHSPEAVAGLTPSMEAPIQTDHPPVVEQQAPQQSAADAAKEEQAFMEAMAQMQRAQQMQEAHQENPTPPPQEVEQTQAARQAIAEQMAVAVNDPQTDVDRPIQIAPPKPVPMRQNKSFFAVIFDTIKNIFTAPGRAIGWAKGKVSTLFENVGAALRRPLPPRATT